MNLANRLSRAVERWAESSEHRQGKEGAAKTFQRVMARRLEGSGGKSGASYRAALTYLNGESEPSLEWLREASELLGVRFAWLVAGQGRARATSDPGPHEVTCPGCGASLRLGLTPEHDP